MEFVDHFGIGLWHTTYVSLTNFQRLNPRKYSFLRASSCPMHGTCCHKRRCTPPMFRELVYEFPSNLAQKCSRLIAKVTRGNGWAICSIPGMHMTGFESKQADPCQSPASIFGDAGGVALWWWWRRVESSHDKGKGTTVWGWPHNKTCVHPKTYIHYKTWRYATLR